MAAGDVLDLLLQRPVFIALALVGAVIATIGSFLLQKRANFDPRLARRLLRLGYAITGASVVIFIAIGFREG